LVIDPIRKPTPKFTAEFFKILNRASVIVGQGTTRILQRTGALGIPQINYFFKPAVRSARSLNPRATRFNRIPA